MVQRISYAGTKQCRPLSPEGLTWMHSSAACDAVAPVNCVLLETLVEVLWGEGPYTASEVPLTTNLPCHKQWTEGGRGMVKGLYVHIRSHTIRGGPHYSYTCPWTGSHQWDIPTFMVSLDSQCHGYEGTYVSDSLVGYYQYTDNEAYSTFTE